MRLVTFWLIMLGLLMVAKHSLADSLSVRGGPSLQDGKPSGETKYFGVRGETESGVGYVATEFGGWADNAGSGRKSSLISKAQIGVNPGSKVGVYGKVFIGPALISGTDTMLGGNFQFAQDFGIGIRDRDTFVEFGYSHVSSAGLSKPNKGRDFLTFGAGIFF